MQNTYKNFLKLSNLYPDQAQDLSEVTLTYQHTQDPISFCFVYCKLYPYMLTLTEKFFYLSEQDKSSFCVEELNKAMNDYDDYFHSCTTIQTLFSRYLTNRLRSESENLNYDKRKCNNNTENYDQVFQFQPAAASEAPYEEINLLESLKTIDLTENELRYCELIIGTATIRDSEIAKLLGISSPAIQYIKNRLMKKLECAF